MVVALVDKLAPHDSTMFIQSHMFDKYSIFFVNFGFWGNRTNLLDSSIRKSIPFTWRFFPTMDLPPYWKCYQVCSYLECNGVTNLKLIEVLENLVFQGSFELPEKKCFLAEFAYLIWKRKVGGGWGF